MTNNNLSEVQAFVKAKVIEVFNPEIAKEWKVCYPVSLARILETLRQNDVYYWLGWELSKANGCGDFHSLTMRPRVFKKEDYATISEHAAWNMLHDFSNQPEETQLAIAKILGYKSGEEHE